MEQREIFMSALRHVAQLGAVAAMTAPKSGDQLFLKGSKSFIETIIVEDRDTLKMPEINFDEQPLSNSAEAPATS